MQTTSRATQDLAFDVSEISPGTFPIWARNPGSEINNASGRESLSARGASLTTGQEFSERSQGPNTFMMRLGLQKLLPWYSTGLLRTNKFLDSPALRVSFSFGGGIGSLIILPIGNLSGVNDVSRFLSSFR
ncbi:hypothetical protein BDW62DRAFT_131594 [Aspergillus aurantiobrunneus]